ncbi:hypothetical protein C4D60_Mb08t13880 [Musa balbisiana]|uniref:Uncharacterized protein n=1 Tax=Musa balbisiana TaxID=52838 RepID=A0A4S8K3Q6_MUSBA|nr:hypothetical protein C4D60_Mb08t13880 [Musa balbisiana]
MAKLGSAHGPGSREETTMIEATEKEIKASSELAFARFTVGEVSNRVSARTNLHRHLNVVGSDLQYRTRRTNYMCL